jgi:hypothetical protein
MTQSNTAEANNKKTLKASSGFKVWEWALLALSLAVTTGAALIYATEYPIRNWIFGLENTEVDRPIGRLDTAAGSIKRQLRRATEFRAIPSQETLYNRDTVVTGPDSAATLEIDEAGSLELGPNTMVRLIFADQATLGGIKRAPVVDLIQGSVTGKAKAAPILLRTKSGTTEVTQSAEQKIQAAKPVPEKKVARVALPAMSTIMSVPPTTPVAAPPPASAPVAQAQPYRILNKPSSLLELSESSDINSLPLELSWKGGADESKVIVEIFRQGSSVPVQTKTITSVSKELNQFKTSLNEAGKFTWRLKDEKGELIQLDDNQPAQGTFVIRPEWKKVSALKSLVGGQEKDNNDFEGGSLKRSPGITFRWKALIAPKLIQPGARAQLKIWDAAEPTKVLFEGPVVGEQYEFSKERLYLGKLNWSVTIPAQGGFKLTTGVQEFQVKFNPPTPVEPVSDATFSRSRLNQSSDGSILLTWKKTLYTDSYEVEIALDPQFEKVIWKAKPKENYALFRAKQDQNLWWRVRSTNSTGASNFNSGRKFTISP